MTCIECLNERFASEGAILESHQFSKQAPAGTSTCRHLAKICTSQWQRPLQILLSAAAEPKPCPYNINKSISYKFFSGHFLFGRVFTILSSQMAWSAYCPNDDAPVWAAAASPAVSFLFLRRLLGFKEPQADMSMSQ